MKFLHIADVHLGCTRYQLAESPRDFFEAWVDVLQKYGIDEEVDFVVIAGDFFHKRSVPPETMNHAVYGLTMMREAGIPVVAIEGNHDQKYSDSEFSWLRSLSQWGLLHLVEPESDRNGKMSYSPWDAAARRGGFVDVGRARIFGSDWYGASGNKAIPALTEAIKQNRREGAFHILLLHTDVEGHQVHPIPAISVAALHELRSAVEYVGLGHTHKHYEIDNWAFNPGSIEITNINEFHQTRGAFIVEADEANVVSSRHVTDYRYRPFQRLELVVDRLETPSDVTREALNKVRALDPPATEDRPAPIIEIALRGQLGFPNSLLELQKIREQAAALAGALHVRVKNQTVPAALVESEQSHDEGRDRLEHRVISDLVQKDSRYRKGSQGLADTVIGAKRMALSDDEPARIAEFISVTSGADTPDQA